MPALLPSERLIAEARRSWVVVLRPPHKLVLVLLAALIVLSIAFPARLAWLPAVIVVAIAIWRVRKWRAERIILTSKRIIRVEGLPETTTTEASLRIDRIAGAVLVQSLPGKLLGYGTIELEAPGDHPDVRKLTTIARPDGFFLALRQLAFGEQADYDLDFGGVPSRGPVPSQGHAVTQPLPPVPSTPYTEPPWHRPTDPDRDRFGRRRG